MLDVIARVKKKLTLAIEFNGLARLVDTIGALEVLLSTLGELSLISVNNLVQVVDLTELASRVGTHDGTLARGEKEWFGHKRCLSSLEYLIGSHGKFVEHFFNYNNSINIYNL